MASGGCTNGPVFQIEDDGKLACAYCSTADRESADHEVGHGSLVLLLETSTDNEDHPDYKVDSVGRIRFGSPRKRLNATHVLPVFNNNNHVDNPADDQ
eukprot:CAMPEP_0171480104 /NCGR_PEP_ID=MMETSP0946-20130122/5853_1 /TAXON_ID=109269 /ORGANISM="Vaucheria litorea, Strain CCMP2940" /LENGTH=97 /DNA_ID=CAMNT_0012011225 /DNA_START=68 /DNA_END=361 /DNA_ORIENTATION=+